VIFRVGQSPAMCMLPSDGPEGNLRTHIRWQVCEDRTSADDLWDFKALLSVILLSCSSAFEGALCCLRWAMLVSIQNLLAGAKILLWTFSRTGRWSHQLASACLQYAPTISSSTHFTETVVNGNWHRCIQRRCGIWICFSKSQTSLYFSSCFSTGPL